MPSGVPLAFTAVFAVWAAGLVMASRGYEPYPALLQPHFGYVADDGGVVHGAIVNYSAHLEDGTTVRIDEKRLLADSGAKAPNVAQRLPSAASDKSGADWLRGRLSQQGLHNVRGLEVTVVGVEFDASTRTWQTGPVIQQVSAPMQGDP